MGLFRKNIVILHLVLRKYSLYSLKRKAIKDKKYQIFTKEKKIKVFRRNERSIIG